MVSTYGWICPPRSVPGTRAPPMRTLTVRIVSECFCKMNLATLRTRGVPCPCRVLSILATLKYAYPRDKIKPFPRSKKTRQLKFVRQNKTGPSMTRFQLGKLFGNTVYSTEYPESPRDPKSMFGLNFIIMSSMFEGVVISMMSTLSD